MSVLYLDLRCTEVLDIVSMKFRITRRCDQLADTFVEDIASVLIAPDLLFAPSPDLLRRGLEGRIDPELEGVVQLVPGGEI